MILRSIRNLTLTLLLSLLCFNAAQAQTTSFTYQGKLVDNAVAANGTYQMQFILFDAPVGGNQVGQIFTTSNVQVVDGIFTVDMDFGANALSGANRYIQIAVFSPTANSFVALNPRQLMTSAPYAIKALNAEAAQTANDSHNLGGVPAAGYVRTTDPRLSDPRDPNPGSGNYVQNRASVQAGANFNIAGNGTVGGILSGDTVNSFSQYNIGNSRVLSVAGTNNTFTGFGAGTVNTGTNNSFFGRSAGFDNTTGGQNSFFGSAAGTNNTSGAENSFFGSGAGDTNTTGNLNSFFGRGSGSANTTGSSNTFVGRESGLANTTGFFNTFVGRNAADINTNGFQNTFLGASTGGANISGNNNTYLGFNAGSLATGNNNTFIGANTGNSDTNGNNNILIGYNASLDAAADGDFVTNSIAIGANAVVTESNRIVLGTIQQDVVIPGDLSTDVFTSRLIKVNELNIGGNQDICRNSSGYISGCSSSRRYKHNIFNYASGLSLINKLRPVSFNWNESGEADMGLVAEEVAEVDPLLASYKDGQVEGVKYNRVGVVLVNAVKEQQAQIEALKEQVELLKKLLCTQNAREELCKSN